MSLTLTLTQLQPTYTRLLWAVLVKAGLLNEPVKPPPCCPRGLLWLPAELGSAPKRPVSKARSSRLLRPLCKSGRRRKKKKPALFPKPAPGNKTRHILPLSKTSALLCSSAFPLSLQLAEFYLLFIIPCSSVFSDCDPFLCLCTAPFVLSFSLLTTLSFKALSEGHSRRRLQMKRMKTIGTWLLYRESLHYTLVYSNRRVPAIGYKWGCQREKG